MSVAKQVRMLVLGAVAMLLGSTVLIAGSTSTGANQSDSSTQNNSSAVANPVSSMALQITPEIAPTTTPHIVNSNSASVSNANSNANMELSAVASDDLECRANATICANCQSACYSGYGHSADGCGGEPECLNNAKLAQGVCLSGCTTC